MKLPVHPFVAAYRRLPGPPDVPMITTLRGNLDAPMLLLCEHPTPEEFEANVPFSGPLARTYAAILEEAGINVDRHFLVMPFSRFGPKANKASTHDTLPFLQANLKHTKVKCVVVIGMTAFGFTFAGGRKTHARSIIGNPMFLPQIDTRAVYVLPNSALLADLGSEDFRAMKKAEEMVQTIVNLTLNLKVFVTDRLGCKL